RPRVGGCLQPCRPPPGGSPRRGDRRGGGRGLPRGGGAPCGVSRAVARAREASREVVPAIASLRAWAEEVRVGELARVRGRLGLSESQEEAIESITAQIVNKLLHPPTVRLKEVAAGADGGGYAQAVRHLFDLGDEE